MALAMSVKFPATPPITGHPSSSARRKPTAVGTHSPFQARHLTITEKRRTKRPFWVTNAVEESAGSSEPETAKEAATDGESKGELSELGSEIKKAMEERKAAEEEEGLLSGVSEEIKKIEWPVFGKVLGTTWVVLGVIAGSSVVLLTLNAVLAEFSDRVFEGRGVQDFFR